MTLAETNTTAAVAEQGAHDAPEEVAPKKGTSKTKGAPKGRKAAKGGKAKAAKPKKVAKASKKADKRAKEGGKNERSNKKSEVIAMMKRAKGVTLTEIVEATGWQKHTIRGFVSILGSKGGETIESSKNEAGERTYRIAK